MNIAIKRSFLRILTPLKLVMKMINKSNTRKEILVVFVPFRTLIQSVATKSDQPGVVFKVSVEKEASVTEGRRGQVRPSDGEKKPENAERHCLE